MPTPKHTFTLSFKESEKWMLEWLKTKSSPGAIIKDAIKMYIEHYENPAKKQSETVYASLDF